MFYNPRNRFYADTQVVPAAIDNWVLVSKNAWEHASQQYTNGWRLIDKKSRSKESIAVLAENRRLKDSVKRAKAQYDRWVTLQTVNDEIMKGCYV